MEIDPADFFQNYQIRRDDVQSPERLQEIYANPAEYYWTQDWSPETYVSLAKAGFISISLDVGLGPNHLLQVPEIQSSYAVLDWENLHLSKSMHRWMRSKKCCEPDYQLETGHDLHAILEGIHRSHSTNWLSGPYENLIHKLNSGIPNHEDFQLMPVGLVNKTGTLVAGEVGYQIGKTYTSLTGFFDRTNPELRNVGKLQLFKLAEHLRDHQFAFWNLGHPGLQYKIDLGAKVLSRMDFLERWLSATPGAPTSPSAF